AEAVLRHAPVVIKPLDKRIIGRSGHLLGDSIGAHQYRNGSIAILAHVTVGLDARANNSFDLIRFFFDPSDVSRQAAERIGKKILGPDNDGKAHFSTKVIGRNSGYRSIEQPLLHSDVAAFVRTRDYPFHILVRIEAEVLDDQSPDKIRASAKCPDPDGFALEIFDGFELRPALEHEMWGRPVAGNDPQRQTLKNRAQGGAITGEVVGVAVTEGDISYRSRDDNQFRIEALLFQEAFLLRQMHGEVSRVRRRADPDLVVGVDRRASEKRDQ